jgi:hypothetical protein
VGGTHPWLVVFCERCLWAGPTLSALALKKKTWWVIPWCLPFPGKIMESIPTPRPSALLNRYSDPRRQVPYVNSHITCLYRSELSSKDLRARPGISTHALRRTKRLFPQVDPYLLFLVQVP